MIGDFSYVFQYSSSIWWKYKCQWILHKKNATKILQNVAISIHILIVSISWLESRCSSFFSILWSLDCFQLFLNPRKIQTIKTWQPFRRRRTRLPSVYDNPRVFSLERIEKLREDMRRKSNGRGYEGLKELRVCWGQRVDWEGMKEWRGWWGQRVDWEEGMKQWRDWRGIESIGKGV